MLQLKNYLPQFLRCAVGDGVRASFWYDYWTELGPIYLMFGASGTRQLRLPNSASVSEAVRNGDWSLPAARSDNAVTLQVVLSTTSVPSIEKGADTYLFISSPPSDLPAAVVMISQYNGKFSSQVKALMKLILQVITYNLWRERNARIFRGTSLQQGIFFKQVDRGLRDRLLSLHPNPTDAHSLLELYFWFIDPYS
ncbi:hypothetical protein Bca52824_088516 [Brassica carinata]|uniref:Uncharacterized protein n=1 Tax=Brassica carinata TaxID=52824 RepID=A0A8X7PE65_BRACI|nr:hypothetical protein Bca52824_088516 [Brassica carinata]